MQQERPLSSNIFTSWSYRTNVANFDMRIFEIKCYFRNLIGQFISFMVCLYTIFFQKVASSKLYIKSEALLPTSATARYHCLQLFYRVKQWMGENMITHEWRWTINIIAHEWRWTINIIAHEWGWTISNAICNHMNGAGQ